MKLAIITESLRRDNHAPLRFFRRLEIVHFFWRAPYQDMTREEFVGATQYRGLLDLYRQLLTEKPDLIQGSEPYASKKSLLLSLVTLLAASKLRIPFFFPTLENLPPRRRFGPFLGQLPARYFAFLARRARMIIALNNGAAANLRAAGVPDSKIIRFPWGIWGIDRTVFYPSKSLPHPAFRQPTVLYAGRLDPEKGIRDILDAFFMLAHKYDGLNLVFVGKGMLEDEVATFAKANKLTGRIHLLGWLPSNELPAYYSAATVTVYPSVSTERRDQAAIRGWSEQVGTVILQSLACGTPVVATRSGSIPEYLPETAGILVPEHDPEGLAQAIERVISSNDLRSRMAASGEEYIAEHFDAKKNVEKAEEMIRSWLT